LKKEFAKLNFNHVFWAAKAARFPYDLLFIAWANFAADA